MSYTGYSVEVLSALPEGAADARACSPAVAADVPGAHLHRLLPSEGVTARDYTNASEFVSLWLTDGPKVEVRVGGCTFAGVPRRGVLDYCPVARIDLFRRAPGHARWLVFAFTPEFAAAVQASLSCDGVSRRADFLFEDARLLHMLGRVAGVLSEGTARPPRMPLDTLAVSILARLLERQCDGRDWRNTAPAFSSISRRRIVDYIHAHLDRDLELTDLSDLVGYSTAQFLRIFRSTFEVTPHQFIINARIDRARFLMQQTEVHLAELAQRLGFSSHAHFSTTFRSRTGMTPSAFRRLCRPAVPCEAGPNAYAGAALPPTSSA